MILGFLPYYSRVVHIDRFCRLGVNRWCQPLSYNITGESAPIIFQTKKCPKKHGGFLRKMTPYP